MENLFVLDFETTGLNPYLNDVIEIAVKKIGENDSYQTLVKPEELPPGLVKYVPPFITKLTGINDQMIIENSMNPDNAITKTVEYINERSSRGPIYIISHNGTTFDFIILRRLMKKYQISERFIKRLKYVDTLLFSKMFIKDGRFRQQDLCKRYNIVNDSEHRAMGDILALEKLYLSLYDEYSLINDREIKVNEIIEEIYI
tara:strand:+ start:1727 stop:2329 length:603 start_codon:yes stop_codon:yes gene_type:complete